MGGRWTLDSDKDSERMDFGHFDTEKYHSGSFWIVKINGKVLGVVPESNIIPKKI